MMIMMMSIVMMVVILLVIFINCSNIYDNSVCDGDDYGKGDGDE